MDEKLKVESDPEKGGFSPPLQKPRRSSVGPAPTDDPREIVNRIIGVVSSSGSLTKSGAAGLRLTGDHRELAEVTKAECCLRAQYEVEPGIDERDAAYLAPGPSSHHAPRSEDLPAKTRDLVLYETHDVAHERQGGDIAELIGGMQRTILAYGTGTPP